MRVVRPEDGGGGGGDFNMPEIPTQQIKRAVLLLVILILVFTGIQLKPWFTVGPNEQAVVLRFGKFNRLVNPGFQFKIPLIEQEYIEAVTENKRIEIGTDISGGQSMNRGDRLMVTGDGALVVASLQVQYQISDPFLFRFNARDAEATLRDISESAMRQIIGDREVDAVLIYGRQEVESQVLALIQEISDMYELGAYVVRVQLQEVVPPSEVKEAFQNVVNAKEENEQLILAAQGYREGRIPQAEAQVAQILNKAKGYRQAKIEEAKGDVQRFDSLLREYRSAEDVTRTRLYLETMEKVLDGRKMVIIEDTAKTLPLLNVTEMIDGR